MCPTQVLGTLPSPVPYFSDFIEGRRGEILDAALVVFGEKGYEAGTMREIAKAIGVTEPALYRHYESKEAILADIVATAGDRISGELRRGLAQIDGENIGDSLRALVHMRRRGLDANRAARAAARATVSADAPKLGAGAGGVMHVLFHAAPHNDTFIGLLRAHLGQPMVAAVRDAVPRIDSHFGITRTPAELESHLRVFMSLFAGYFTTSLLFDAPPNDDAIVDALVAIMGWEPQAE
jgi:AcrR family transcriptional regulator